MLKPDALQNIKLSVLSSGPDDKVEIKWGAKNEDGRLSDQACKIEGNVRLTQPLRELDPDPGPGPGPGPNPDPTP